MTSIPAKPTEGEDITDHAEPPVLPPIPNFQSASPILRCPSKRRRTRSERNDVYSGIDRVRGDNERRRTHSDPLSKEAEEVATELKRRSDTFYYMYCKRGSPVMVIRSRQASLPVGGQKNLIDKKGSIFGDRELRDIKQNIAFKPGTGTEV